MNWAGIVIINVITVVFPCSRMPIPKTNYVAVVLYYKRRDESTVALSLSLKLRIAQLMSNVF